MRREGRCYLSGPITGVDGYMENFERYEKLISQEWGGTVINPAKVNSGLPDNTSYDEYMEMSIAMMNMCDTIFLMPGWRKSKGAKFEREYAIIKGMVIYEINSAGVFVLADIGGSV